MVNYSLATCLLVLLAVVAAVLAVALVDSYGQIDVPSLLSGRSFRFLGLTDKQGVDEGLVLGGGSERLTGFVDYPVVHLKRTAGDVFGPGVFTKPEQEE